MPRIWASISGVCASFCSSSPVFLRLWLPPSVVPSLHRSGNAAYRPPHHRHGESSPSVARHDADGCSHCPSLQSLLHPSVGRWHHPAECRHPAVRCSRHHLCFGEKARLIAYKKAFLVQRDEPETLSLLYYVLLAEVLLLIHDINRIALEKCLDVGGYLLVEALASLVGGPGNMRGEVSIRLAKERILL